ncbi:AEC family transporter [Aquibacillus sp. 3ASR75-11]|uniref:AEC family transporter n=1 Tax=Terrihalobacillus insolitus TaxID=2950438 RepID=A0A9X3WNV2_9BACI|nr:AEC family transporter [Terrihalobacillus insolitus]MDC3423110.1 AEC family transporter [Terrihalobacillus insolitus]
MDIFLQVVLPVLVIFITGYGIQKWRSLDIKSISTVAIYILTPTLVFRTFYRADLDQQYIKMVIFSIVLLVVIIMINKIYAKIMHYPSSIESGLILSTAFMNSGNYGAPIVLFAFGDRGFAYSVSFLVLQAIIMNFFGVYYAARGVAGVKKAMTSVLQMPATYAVIIALFLQIFQLPVSNNIFSAIDLVAEATIPVVMLVLGMQLAEIKITNLQWGKISYGLIVRLIVSPVIAFLILLFLPMDPLLEKLSAAMPSAATTTMYAVQFDAEPELVSSITLITTFVSIFSITLLLVILA